MDKFANILQEDIDNLISKLLGKSIPTMTSPSISKEDSKSKENSSSTVSQETYQLPVKHTKGGAEIDENNKPWIVGHFAPGVDLNETHPHGHDGVDLKAPKGTPIYPIASGKVIENKTYPKGGKTCKVAHEDGKVISYYAHLDSVSVFPGENVTQQTILGTMGDSGNAKGRGAHLHYEVSVNGKKVDPKSITGKKVGSLSKIAEFQANIIKALDDYSNQRKQSLKKIADKLK